MTVQVAPGASVLVSTEEIADRLGEPGLHIVEVDEDTDAYAHGHIPGALALHWRDDLQDPLRRGILDPRTFEGLLGARGIAADDPIVIYGGNNNWFAAYAYWYLRYYGHQRLWLMDGGRKKWELEGRPLTTEVHRADPATYRIRGVDASIRAVREEVLAAEAVAKIDVRSPEEFSGVLAAPAHLPQEQAQRSGHIPGARNVPWSRATTEDGSFRGADELRAIYVDGAALSPEEPVIVYCRIGERSSHTWVALHDILGFGNVKNYDGSWTEYGSLVDVPIER